VVETWRGYEMKEKLTKTMLLKFHRRYNKYTNNKEHQSTIPSFKNPLDRLRKIKRIKLASFDLYNNEKLIKKTYNGLKVNSTAKSRILHMLNVHLFPIWDEEIRQHYGVADNSQGYFNYMGLVKRQLLKLGAKDVKAIEKTTKESAIKLIDEMNWIKEKCGRL